MKPLFVLLVMLPVAAHAYGTRSWLSANQHYSEDLSDNTYSWGYNYHARGRHTTVRIEEDRSGWMHNGNVRNGTAPSIMHWEKVTNPR